MKQNKEPRNKPPGTWPQDLQQQCQDNSMGKRPSRQQRMLGKLDVYMPNNEVDPYLTLYTTINSKWIKDL